MRKGTTCTCISCISRIFILKRLYLWNHSSYVWAWNLAWIFFHHPTIYTRYKLQVHPFPVWARRAHVSIAFENHWFMPCFGGSLLGTGGLLRLLTLDLWSRRPKLLANQARSILRDMVPFLISYHNYQCWSQYLPRNSVGTHPSMY